MTRTFEAVVTVGATDEPRMVRVHVGDAEEVAGALQRLLPTLRRVREFRELPPVRETGTHASVDVRADGSVVWAGNCDVDAAPPRIGAHAHVTVDARGDVRVELFAAGNRHPFAPLDYREEALALRAAVRALAFGVAEADTGRSVS